MIRAVKFKIKLSEDSVLLAWPIVFDGTDKYIANCCQENDSIVGPCSEGQNSPCWASMVNAVPWLGNGVQAVDVFLQSSCSALGISVVEWRGK